MKTLHSLATLLKQAIDQSAVEKSNAVEVIKIGLHKEFGSFDLMGVV